MVYSAYAVHTFLATTQLQCGICTNSIRQRKPVPARPGMKQAERNHQIARIIQAPKLAGNQITTVCSQWVRPLVFTVGKTPGFHPVMTAVKGKTVTVSQESQERQSRENDAIISTPPHELQGECTVPAVVRPHDRPFVMHKFICVGGQEINSQVVRNSHTTRHERLYEQLYELNPWNPNWEDSKIKMTTCNNCKDS